MSGTWNLDTIYKEINTPEFADDWMKLSECAGEIAELAENLFADELPDIEKMRQWILRNETFQCLHNRLYSYVSFRLSVNGKDQQADARLFELNLISDSLSPANARFAEFMSSRKHVPELCKQDDLLLEYNYYFQKITDHNPFRLSPGEEKILSGMAQTGSKAWERFQVNLSSQMEQNFSDDRKEQFSAQMAEYGNHAACSAYALNSIKGEAISICKLRGYGSPLEKTLRDCHMDQEILTAMIGSIVEYLPKLQRYYKIKAHALGYSSGLPYYERESSITAMDRTFTMEEAQSLILKAFKSFSPNMYDYGRKAFGGRWIDYRCASGKMTGASCDGVYAIGESRIRMSYMGTLPDVIMLAHELGHGYHNSNLFQERILNFSYDLPIAETASKFSELIVKSRLNELLGHRDKLYFDDFILSGFINTIVDIQSRFYFEDAFFRVRRDRELQAEEIKELMAQAQIKSYGDSLDQQFLHPFMWMNKPHYYFPDRNYYNFPYSFGTLLSIGMYGQYRSHPGEFAADYDTFLASTGKMNVYDLCRILDLDVKSKDIWRRSLDYIVGLMEELEKSLPA